MAALLASFLNMFSWIWHTFFFDPVYNGLVFFIDIVPGGDVGLAIVGTTVVVKVILLPLSVRAVKTQVAMREIEPRMKKIKEEITDKQEQAQAMLALYKEAGVNPFASIILLFIQIPIIIALYLSVSNGGGNALPAINTDLLYSFVPSPERVNMLFVGFFDMDGRSIILALLAGASQFLHTHLSLPKLAPKDPNAAPSMKDDFARNMQLQMRYVLPIVITVFAYTISAAIALYFFVSNVMSIAQEFYVRRHRPDPATETADTSEAK